MENEVRYFDASSIETRSEGDKMSVKGYAVIFGSPSKLIGGEFIEVIENRAFDGVDLSNVFMLYNHSINSILGNTKSGTLSLRVDDKGLSFSAELPNTQLGRDTFELVKRSDVSGVSFGFIVDRDSWNTRVSPELRTIKKFKEVREISITPYPAYEKTTVSTRAVEFLGECRECRANFNQIKMSDEVKKLIKEVS